MMISKKVQFWKGTDARMIDVMVFCFVILVCDITCINSDVSTAYFNLLLFLWFHYADDKGFICQQCGLVRNKEEIKRLASELKPLSDKATMSSSSRILL